MIHMLRLGIWGLVASVVMGGGLYGQTALSTSFEKGRDGKPEGWRQAGSPGAWEQEGHTGNRSVSVTGDGKNNGRWNYPNPPLEPNRTYRLSAWYKSDRKGKAPNSILIGINTSFKKYPPSDRWTQAVLTFRAPADGKGMAVRLSHFRFDGKVWFDDLKIEPVGMVYARREGVPLDENERIAKGQYTFKPNMDSPYTNCYRVTVGQTVIHHENRMWFRENRYLIHKYQVGDYPQLEAELSMKVSQEGQKKGKRQPLKGKIELSKDGRAWTLARSIDRPEDLRLPIPKDFLPAKAVYVRVSGDGNFQVRGYCYSAKLDGSPPDMKGRTQAFRPNHLLLGNGALRLVIEEGDGPVVSIRRKGRIVGRVELLLAQFEKKGVGYKKTGIATAPAERVKSFAKAKGGPGKRVAEVVVERTTSEPAKRKFEATVRLTLPDNEPWLESQLISVKNTDTTEVKLVGYDHRLQPGGGVERPKAHVWDELAAWIAKERFLGALSRRAGDFVFGFRADFGDITRRVEAALPPGQTWTGKEPSLVVYVGEGTGDAFDRETSRVRQHFGLLAIKRQKPSPDRR